METSAMLRLLVFIAVVLTSAPALALDLPARTAGLWEVEITHDPAGYGLPPRRSTIARQCLDGTVDELFWRRDLEWELVEGKTCSGTISRANGTITADLFCNVRGTDMKARMIFSGDFKRAYTKDATASLAPIGGVTPAPIHVITKHKYIGACEADQRPGDFITEDGSKIHLFGGPKPPSRP
jgi:hypothetical protein